MAIGIISILMTIPIWMSGQKALETPVIPLRVTSVISDDFNRCLETKEGWIGGDAVYTFSLSGEKIAWVFGDSLFGKVKDGKRVETVMVNNAIAISGKDPLRELPVFISPENTQGKKMSFFRPAQNKGYYWPLACWGDQEKIRFFSPK